jgi:alpha-L-fucosidase
LPVPMTNQVTRAYLLANPQQTLSAARADGIVELRVPAVAPDRTASVIVAEVSGSIQPVDAVLQADDGSLRLLATEAEIKGTKARLEGEGEQANVGYWMDAADSVAWNLHASLPGIFKVELSYACDPTSAGSDFSVLVANQALRGRVASTGGWNAYQRSPLGQIRLDSPGPFTLEVKPLSKPGLAVMNLRSVILTRVGP